MHPTPDDLAQDPSIYFVMSSNIDQHYDVLMRVGILLEAQNDPTIILDPTGPQALQLTLQLMRLQRGLKWVTRQPSHNVKDRFR